MRAIVAMIIGFILMIPSALTGKTQTVEMYLLKWPLAANEIERLPLRWDKSIVTYTFATRAYDFPQSYARNCPVVMPAREILKYSKVSFAEFTVEVDKAIRRWSEVVNLKFVRVTSTEKADVVIGAMPSNQNYGKAFADLRIDSVQVGGMYRIAKGVICMRQDIMWETIPVDDTSPGIGTAVTHEIGHVIGLDHPPNSLGAVMAYRQFRTMPFSESDIRGAQHLYGGPR